MTNAVNGKSVRWTKSSRSLDTRPLRVFIIKSICSFIICISATMWGGTVSVMDGRLVSNCFGLLEALLPSDPSLFLRSALVPSWSSFWVFIIAFFWRNYSFRSWFCLVRRSTTVAKVWTCLSRAVVRGSLPWLLMVVAIEQVNTMQLFVREAVNMAYLLFSHWHCQLMMSKIVSKPHNTHMLKMIPVRPKTKKNPKRVPVWYQPKTFRRLSQKNLSQL